MNLSDALSARIVALGMTQKQVAELSGLPFMTVSNIIRGNTSNPGVQNLRLIAEALQCTIDDLVYEDNLKTVLSTNEKNLITAYRNSSRSGQQIISNIADVVAKELPRNSADVKPRRHEKEQVAGERPYNDGEVRAAHSSTRSSDQPNSLNSPLDYFPDGIELTAAAHLPEGVSETDVFEEESDEPC